MHVYILYVYIFLFEAVICLKKVLETPVYDQLFTYTDQISPKKALKYCNITYVNDNVRAI